MSDPSGYPMCSYHKEDILMAYVLTRSRTVSMLNPVAGQGRAGRNLRGHPYTRRSSDEEVDDAAGASGRAFTRAAHGSVRRPQAGSRARHPDVAGTAEAT